MKRLLLAGLGGVLLTGSALAGETKSVPLTLRVLVDPPPPCTVKGSNVDFGDVIIKKINGTEYRKDAGYTLNCANSLSDDLQMQFKGHNHHDQWRNGVKHGNYRVWHSY